MYEHTAYDVALITLSNDEMPVFIIGEDGLLYFCALVPTTRRAVLDMYNQCPEHRAAYITQLAVGLHRLYV
jgi:hypothetical protein